MQATAKTELASLVKDHLTSLVREAICIQRHAKRARYHQTSEDDGVIRQRIHAEDINLALQWRGSDVLYATGTVVPMSHDSKRKVDLNAYLKSEMQDRPPSEIGLTMHWLSVDGVQPHIPQNPSQAESIVHRVEEDDNHLAQHQDQQQGVRVRQLLPRLLSEELQLYFTRITLALERGGSSAADRQQQDDALARVARDAGLQELVPFFVQYLAKQLHFHVGHPEHCRTLIRLARSLLINPYVHLELHLHQLLPAIMTNVVAKNLSTLPDCNHWSLRIEAAEALRLACDLFGEKYASLKATVLKKLFEAISDDRPLTTIFGGLVGISTFGPKAVDAFVLPLAIHYWNTWAAVLDKTTGLIPRFEIQQCQQAMLTALGVFLQGTNAQEQASRLSMEELEEALGDQLVPLRKEPNEYSMCFI